MKGVKASIRRANYMETWDLDIVVQVENFNQKYPGDSGRVYFKFYDLISQFLLR